MLAFLSPLCCLAAAASAAAVQTTLYVAPGGSDVNPGTEAKPFATVEKARQAVRAINKNMAGDIVVVLCGGVCRLDRTLAFGPEDSGTNGHDVIYRAAPHKLSVLSGGRPITAWQPDAGKRWKARTDLENFRQLYVGGVRAVRARSGKLGRDTNAGRWEFLHNPVRGGRLKDAEAVGNKGYRITEVGMADWHNISDIEFCYVGIEPGWSWSHSRCKVQSITRDGSRAMVTLLQPYFTHARTKAGVTVKLPDYVENALELLDEPGEWYFDRPAKTVYYIPRPGEDMSTVEVIAPAVETLVDVRGTLDRPVHNIRFEGIVFQHGGWLRPSAIGHCDVQANFTFDPTPGRTELQEGALRNPDDENVKSPANVVCHAAKSICFDRCTFTQLGGAGLDIEWGSQDNVVSGCRFCDIAGSAVQIGDVRKDDHHPDDPRKIVKNNSVVNCFIHDCCVEYMSGVGVFAGYTEGTRIAHNEICRLPYSAISVGWGWGQEDAGGGGYHQPYRYPTPTPAGNNRIEHNHLHDLMNPMMDGGGIYTLGNQPGTVIRGNHIHHNTRQPGGIYLDEGSGFIEVTGNLVHDVVTPMNYNNGAQNRRATCKEHDNFFGTNPDAARPIAAAAGLEAAHRDLLEQKP
jgi:hypothetical protein